jgi:large subunit ribosomal protein L13
LLAIFAPLNFGETRTRNTFAVDTLSYKTISANKENADKKWLLVDAEGQTLGRIASEVAKLLRGKHKPNFTPHADCGDYVIVINAEKIKLTGKKWDQKVYMRYTGYPGGQRTRTAAEVMARKPFSMVEEAVRGMLSKNTLGRALFRNMHVYVGAAHKHEAQEPKTITFNH